MNYRHFDFMGKEQREITRQWYCAVKSMTWCQGNFLDLVGKALDLVDKDYFIATMEPSVDENFKIYYQKGDKVARYYSCRQWKWMAKAFAPELESTLATKYQLVLWYAYRIAIGYWTLSYVCDDSSAAGNYWNSPNATHDFEVTGAREVGGANDGVGNTSKIVTDDGEDAFLIFGGDCGVSGQLFPVADIDRVSDSNKGESSSSGVVVINKVVV